MLGAGGLIRAYTDGAVAAIEAGEVVHWGLHRQIFAELDYTWLGKMENELRNRGTKSGETQFSDKVTLLCLPREEEAEEFKAWLVDITQGQVILTEGEKLYFEI
jgi:putative IMPACT (imprinted ancient) family translation regulator